MPNNKKNNKNNKNSKKIEISKHNINRKLGNCMKKYKIMNPKQQSNYTYNSKEEYDKSFKDEKMKNLRPVFLLTILSFSVAGISGDLLKMVFNRPRPILTYVGELSFLTDSNSLAFPSGHATKSVALALPLIFNNITNDLFARVSKIVVLSTAILVCLSRIILGAHYLSDVLAGAGWSVLCLPVSVFLTNRLLSKMSPERFEFASRIWIIVFIALIFFVVII